MPRMPCWLPASECSSVLSLATVAAFATSGAIIRQGPHYGAQKSTTSGSPSFTRNLLYTGVTRGKRLVVLVGQPKAVTIAVKNGSGRRRWSKLVEWL